MCYQGHAYHGFGFHPFGFFCHRPRPIFRRDEYFWMLERYKEELEAELREVEREIVGIKKEKE